DHEVDANSRARHRLEVCSPSGSMLDDRPSPAVRRLGVGPVVELLAAAARADAPHARVRTLAVRALELLVRGVAVLVPVVVVLLGDAEIDECAVPEIAEAHVTTCEPATT